MACIQPKILHIKYCLGHVLIYKQFGTQAKLLSYKNEEYTVYINMHVTLTYVAISIKHKFGIHYHQFWRKSKRTTFSKHVEAKIHNSILQATFNYGKTILRVWLAIVKKSFYVLSF
jgi:hypothetical protein